MSKRKKRRPSRQDRKPSTELRKKLERADQLLKDGHVQAARTLLEPSLDAHPRVADLHYHIGYTRILTGDVWEGLNAYERAAELGRQDRYWLPLAALYLDLDMNVHALQAMRRAPKSLNEDMRTVKAALEREVQELAQGMDLTTAQAERGLWHFEAGRRHLNAHDFATAIVANRKAIKLLGEWYPLYNNLALALFFDGQSQEAFATNQRVRSAAPDNVQALSDAVRFLTWTGQNQEAQAIGERLKDITPQDAKESLKLATAAAILEQDERVYQLLHNAPPPDVPTTDASTLYQNMQWLLAIAEANTGRPTARDRLAALQDEVYRAGPWIEALDAGKPGLGWCERFPYFHYSELIPRARLDEFFNLLAQRNETSPSSFGEQMSRFIERFPQMVRVVEKMMWEEGQVEGGLAVLEIIGTPAAYAALRRFGLSQAGKDKDRLDALLALAKAGQIDRDETLRVWQEGEWQELQIRGHEISDEFESPYSPQVADLLNRALEQFHAGEEQQAEQLLERVLTLEPRAKEAYNNLASLYAHREQHERAREMYRKALEIDPLYALPRCNLAGYLLQKDDIEGAKAMLAPLSEVTRLYPQAAGFYYYMMARVLLQEHAYEKARKTLEASLAIDPDYAPAQELLMHIELAAQLGSGLPGFSSFFEQQYERDRAWRERLQAKLSSASPTLAKALPLYTKDALTATARRVIWGGSWSALRKAELVERIVQTLQNPDGLEWVVTRLEDEDRAALQQVLSQGGTMPWQDFDAAYDNDLEESRHWEYHEPQTVMGRLRLRGLLVEATVDDELLIVMPVELRPLLRDIL